MSPSDFFQRFSQDAQKASIATGVPALVILAQSALETGYGNHAPGNMYFGIKADKSWNGKKQLLWTHEIVKGQSVKLQDWFRAYDSPRESFQDWGDFLRKNKRYANVFKATNTVEAARELQKSGYSTSPIYADSLILTAAKLSPDSIPVEAVNAAKVNSKAKAVSAKIANLAPGGKTIAGLILAGTSIGLYLLFRSKPSNLS